MSSNNINTFIRDTKLSPPLAWGRDLLERPRLQTLYTQHRTTKLILVSASAGYGKSTLMAQWRRSLQQRDLRTAWLTLDDDDNDPGRLFSYLRYVLGSLNQPADPTSGPRTITKNHANFLASLFSAEDAPATLFLDEFEALHNQESIHLLEQLLQLMPPGRQIVVASRSKPDWSLAKLKLQGELLELSDQELRFNVQEATYLGELKLTGPLNAIITSTLIDKTEGWIAGIRLAMLCFPRIEDAQQWVDNISGEIDEITNFLTEEVFRHLGTEQQLLLLKIAILDRLCAPLCEALTGEPGAQTMLESLCEKGLFIHPLDEQRRWFRLHGLVRQFLLKKLTQLIPQKMAVLHESAANWLYQHNFNLDAIHHAIAAKKPLLAINILESYSRILITQGQLRTITNLASDIAKLHPIDSPTLLSSMCWANLFLHEQERASELLERLRKIHQQQPLSAALQSQLPALEALLFVIRDEVPKAAKLAEAQLSTLNANSHFERGVLCNTIALAKMGTNDLQLSQQYQLKARAAHLKSGSYFGLAYSDMLAALREKQQGHLLAAKARFNAIGNDDVYQQFDDATLTHHICKAVINGFEVQLLYELNQLSDAQYLLEQHFTDAVNNTIPPDMIIIGYLTRARIAFVNGDLETSYTFLEEGEITGISWRLPRLVKEMRWERVRFALLRDELVAAKQFAAHTTIDHIPSTPSGFYNPADESGSLDIAPLRFDIYTGNPSTALTHIDKLIIRSCERPCRQLPLLVLKALAHITLSDIDSAELAMTKALDLGHRIHAVRSIIDEGPRIIALIKQLHGRWKQQPNSTNKERLTYCETLLAATGEELSEVANLTQVEPLSDRELEILHLVGEGLRNDLIAEKLFLSINTVKWHLRRAYEKLNVHSRTEAVAESRRLGLID